MGTTIVSYYQEYRTATESHGLATLHPSAHGSSSDHDCSRHCRYLSRTSFSFRTPDRKFESIPKATSPTSIRTPAELHLCSDAFVLLVLTYTFHKASSRFDPRRVGTWATPNHPSQSFPVPSTTGMLYIQHCQGQSSLFLKYKPEQGCTGPTLTTQVDWRTPLATAYRTLYSKPIPAALHRPCRTTVYRQSG